MFLSVIKKKNQGGHLEYLTNSFSWNYSLGVEFILLKEKERKTTPTLRGDLSFKKQTPDFSRLQDIQALYSLVFSNIRKINRPGCTMHF